VGDVTELLGAALRYAEHGWPVFPCEGKRPLVAHGLHDATTDRGAIERWWARVWPSANVAVRTGREAGLVVLDVDGDDGADALHDLEREHANWPTTATVKTPRGGEHVYFRHPGNTDVPNSAGRLGAGLDIRGDGGYVLAPPSAVNGRRYEPDERARLAPCPDWLLALIADHASAPRKPAPPSEWIAIVRDGVEEGKRNEQLARLVGHLLRRYVDVDLAAEIALLVNEQRSRPPLPRVEVDRIVDSIAAREARRRERAA
jgi:Bifunctional DNA primase/polymerase, N-terminal/Primase C terminal 1 (PriCT-1)